jgi:bifunctional non-homologous end joining protein LigD
MKSTGALADYKRKRHFDRTPEPQARVAIRPGWSYVVQKHDASRLHYDFRLELDGVLKSWAVPKGPSLDPTVKRLAVHVEDHPVDYGEFEGVIPEGQYGGGTVLLWDIGTWQPIGDPHDGYKKGKLKFKLFGQKLQGGWMLIRSRSLRKSNDGKEWLLIKEQDDLAQDSKAVDILEDAPLSVVSNRDLKEIASARDRVWSSKVSTNRPTSSSTTEHSAQTKTVPVVQRSPRSTQAFAPDIAGTESAKMPASLKVQLATLTDGVPEGEVWLHEIKFDGYRMVCRVDGDDVRFISRNQQDWTKRLKPLAQAVKKLGIVQCLLDGEIVFMRQNGSTDFQALQNAFRDGRIDEIHYYVFDLVYLNGFSLKAVPLVERKRILAALISKKLANSRIHLSEHLSGSGQELVEQACKLHLEGIISKRRDRPYQEGRSSDWLKTKCVKREEFVIGGFTEPTGARNSFGALLVGYHDAQGDLRYSGKVGTGFDQKTLKALLKELTPLEQKSSPFSDLSRRTGPVRTAHWVRPALVAQIAYGSRTSDGKLRHASFEGLREDKSALDVSLEKTVPLTCIAKTTGVTHESRQRRAAKADDSENGLHGVRLTSPDKLLYPDEGITKRDLADYYSEIADWILPHVVNRPLSLVRSPDGIGQESFFQKHPGVGTPSTLGEFSLREKRGLVKYSVVKDVRGLISLAQISAVEIHTWGSRIDNLEKPDRLVFDLDADTGVPWERVVESARAIRDFLKELGLESFVKTTGGKGLHLVVPIDRRHLWDEAKSFCKQVAETIVAAAPELYTANMTKAARTNRIFIDYLRNGRGATTIVSYSTRARPGAPVSVPLTWKELTPQITSDQFNLFNVRKRLQSLRNDPWDGIRDVRQGLARPIKKLQSLR